MTKNKKSIIDDDALITPKENKLPDLPSLSGKVGHLLPEGISDKAHIRAKMAISIGVVILVLIGLATFFGLSSESDRGKESSVLAKVDSSVSDINGEVLYSVDGGSIWLKLDESVEIRSGMRITTGENAGLKIWLDDSYSSVVMGSLSEISIAFLNSARVDMTIVEGDLNTDISPTNKWSFVIGAGEDEFVVNGEATIEYRAGIVKGYVEKGLVRGRGSEYMSGDSF